MTNEDFKRTKIHLGMILTALENVKEKMPEQARIGSEAFKIDRLVMDLLEKAKGELEQHTPTAK